eukprot:8697590-Pyramimonas_sp.AAC.1
MLRCSGGQSELVPGGSHAPASHPPPARPPARSGNPERSSSQECAGLDEIKRCVSRAWLPRRCR